MTKLTIDNKEYEIEDEVSDLIVMVSRERDELKETLKAKTEPVAEVPCSAGLSALIEEWKENIKPCVKKIEAGLYLEKADRMKSVVDMIEGMIRQIEDLMESR